MTAPFCKCGCGKPLTKHSYETLSQWKKRLKSGYFRARCKKNVPDKPPHTSPPLGPLSSANYEGGGKAVPKETTPRDPAYLDFVRTFDCIGCGWPAHLKNVDAHHIDTGGTSIKCSDYFTVPLCSADARGCHPAADKSPETADGFRPYALMLQTLWIKAGNKIKKGG